MNPHDKRVIHSSAECGWRTPDPMFDLLDSEFYFALDAAAVKKDSKCHAYLGPDHEDSRRRDALVVDWRTAQDYDQTPGYRPVFINPPFSVDLYRKSVKAGHPDKSLLIESWAEKCATEGQRVTVVGVFPAGTQTRWWYSFVRNGPMRAREIRSIPHRVSFLRPDGSKAHNAGGNTAVVIWTPNPGYVGDWAPAERVWTWRTWVSA